MKKTISLLLALVLCLSLCACGQDADTSAGNPAETKADASEATTAPLSAEGLDFEVPEQVFETVEENQARAMLNPHLVVCTVGSITTTFFECAQCSNIRVCLPTETLAQLNSGDLIGVFGRITDVTEEKSITGYTLTVTFGEAQLYDGELPRLETMEYYLEKDYQNAVGMMAEGKYSSALKILLEMEDYKDVPDLLLKCCMNSLSGTDYLNAHKNDFKPLSGDELRTQLTANAWATSDETWHFYEDGTLDPGRIRPLDGAKIMFTWSVDGDTLTFGNDSIGYNSVTVREAYEGALVAFTEEGNVYKRLVKAE